MKASKNVSVVYTDRLNAYKKWKEDGKPEHDNKNNKKKEDEAGSSFLKSDPAPGHGKNRAADAQDNDDPKEISAGRQWVFFDRIFLVLLGLGVSTACVECNVRLSRNYCG